MRLTVMLAVLLAMATPTLAQMKITDKAIVRKTGTLQLDIHYPVTGIAAMDRLLDRRAMAKMDAQDLEGATPERPYSVEISYKIRRNDAKMLSVQFTSYVYTGGAHGAPDMQSYNFLMPDHAQVFIAELLDGSRGLRKISALAIDDLSRRMGGDDFGTIESGAGPQAGNFANFIWLPKALELDFPPYQVASYAAGAQAVTIPFAKIADVIRPDPRAPAPSFSCKAAHSAIEKSICGDAALARLDRQAAERYAELRALEKIGEQSPRRQARHEALVASQRAWVAQRDKDCATGDRTCLTTSYTARRKFLADPPL